MIRSINTEFTAKSVWVSDIHMGSCGSNTKAFMQFLNHLTADTLFLNGDIFDKWLLSETDDLEPEMVMIIDKINALTVAGTKVVFLPGNHDSIDQVKKYFSGVAFCDEYNYESVLNKSYLIFHGHCIDPTVAFRSEWISRWGTFFYEFLLSKKKATHKMSFSRFVKVFIKKVIVYVFMYDKRLYRYVRKQKMDGVICGHSHQPLIKQMKGLDYFNSGDWIDNCTFLMETYSGDFQLCRWA